MQLMNSTNDHACHLRKHALYICLKLQLVKPAAKRQNHSGFYEASSHYHHHHHHHHYFIV